MHHKSEHQEQFHWFTPEDCRSCRACPIKNPESLHFNGNFNMDPEYRSSYISYPMVDRTMKILPREVFRIEPDPDEIKSYAKDPDRNPEQTAAIIKLAEDKFKRDVAAREQRKCHIQMRSSEWNQETAPSEYKRQFVSFPIEKAHSIPQITHIKIQGEFTGVPEYQDSYKMYAHYARNAPIKKKDNLNISGAEVQASSETSTDVPEYREKFCDPPKDVSREKSLKTEDHLHPSGEFTKDVPEYYQSFSDPQVREVPERGKCREPYLRLKGKIEFNPEYSNNYLDFPRSRPIVKKPISTFRLPASSTTTKEYGYSKSPKQSPRRKYSSSSPSHHKNTADFEGDDLKNSPEYRRAQYNYQIRKRTPTRKVLESDGGGNSVGVSTQSTRKASQSSVDIKPHTIHKRRQSRHRLNSEALGPKGLSHFENAGNTTSKKQPKFGRRASVLQSTGAYHDNSEESEERPRYTLKNRRSKHDLENQDSFVVLNEPCKRSNWMKKSWYDT